MKTQSIIHISDLKENKYQYQTANHQYYMVYVVDLAGNLVPCLITENDVLEGIDRAVRNSEDIVPMACTQYLRVKIVAFWNRCKALAVRFL